MPRPIPAVDGVVSRVVSSVGANGHAPLAAPVTMAALPVYDMELETRWGGAGGLGES